ncbi:Peptidase S41A [Rhodopirellula maiorica SM1]|uniref:Peptidase S41A n=1 Tax=Rhodopirellula maiorica SM1 TaxID=1265738 RepID=M5RAY2_9BACT|nr:S41 family peptidase [Rhodopirellula maiorica]EMI16648.1 Peptidase S41A [Rhodopirellula maiorica SM1]
MPSRNLNIILLTFCFSLLCYLTHRRAKPAMLVGDALDLIHHHYVDPIDEERLLTAAMNGMTSILDQNCEYIPLDAYASFQDSMSQEFAGIGIYVEQPDITKPVRIVTPLVGSPALRAGMMPGDEIVKIDGEDVARLSLKEVSARLKGPIGTVVYVVVRRDNQDGDAQELSLSIDRSTIELESVIGDYRDEDNDWVYRLQDDPSIAYVRLTSFGEKTDGELRTVLERLNNDFRGLVLDLRGNSGGLLYAAVNVCDMFLDRGRIVSTRIRGGKVYDEFDAQPGTLVNLDKPVAVLIDGNSASASEIVAACLQDHKRAVVVGTRSYGKGTVQNILPLQYGRSALRLTVARYYRPNGKNIHRVIDAQPEDEWGVSPNADMEVSLDENTLEKLSKRWREASYPSLAAASEIQLHDEEPASDDGASSDKGALSDKRSKESTSEKQGTGAETKPEGGLSLDPVLRRAVEAIDSDRAIDDKPSNAPVPAAA